MAESSQKEMKKNVLNYVLILMGLYTFSTPKRSMIQWTDVLHEFFLSRFTSVMQ